ncbi:MAG TPA: PilZ domain-containing protein [Candidatus Tectomicrobia bacterium]
MKLLPTQYTRKVVCKIIQANKNRAAVNRLLKRLKDEEDLLMDPHVEHRKHPRHPVCFKCIFSPDGTRIEDGVVRDLSAGGCRMTSTSHVPSDTSMELHIRPDRHTPIYIPGAVVRWVGDSTFGVDFSKLPELESATLTRLLWSLPT